MFRSLLLFLSLLLHKTTGAAARHAVLVLSGALPLVEDPEALQVLLTQAPNHRI